MEANAGSGVSNDGADTFDSDKPSQMEGFPMKEWTVKIFMLDSQGRERKADCFTKVVYNLHPSFENPTQSRSPPPTSFDMSQY